MRTRHRTLNRTFAVGTALTLGLGGALIAAPAFAADGDGTVPVTGEAYEAQAEELMADDAVAAVGRDADDNLVIVTIKDNDATAVDALEAANSNVVVREIEAPLESFAADDVVGGAGYMIETAGGLFACSIGFSAWTPAGDPALISAGHCAEDPAVAPLQLTLPSAEPAEGGTGGIPAANSLLGDFGFSQYGGAGNTAGADGDLSSIDISVIDVNSAALTLLPAVTDWTTASTDDLAASAANITAVGEPVVGQTAYKSGRTTGFSNAIVDIVDGWASVSGHWVQGFGAYLGSDEGDSGGAVYQGNTAVGVVSGGDPATGYTWAAGLQNALTYTGGYTVMLHVDAPAVTGPAAGTDVEPGTAITGTAPAGTTLVVTPASGPAFEIAVAGDGTWSFPAPSALGAYSFSALAQNGFNKSASVNHSVTVVAAPLAVPSITSPADGAQITGSVDAVTGTGIPGATVTVTGDVTGTATVGSDGNWTVAASLGYGSYAISVSQAAGGQTSPAATAAFAVIVPAPGIVSPANGSEFASDKAPITASGTGTDGATVTVSLNGEEVGTAVVASGVWSVSIAGLATTGANTITASQQDGTVSSVVATSTFTVVAAPAPGGGGGGDAGNGGGLATTGGPDVTPYVAVSALLLMIGAGLFVVSRRRKSTVSVDA